MAFDNHKNFAYSTVLTAPSPATSGTSIVVQSGDGTKFPTAPFNATIWPAGVQPLPSNAEIVRVTAVSTDTFTITRAQESSSARSVGVGDQIGATITGRSLTDLENLFPYDGYIVPSGADGVSTFSTMGAAITAGKQCVFGRKGTYSESSVTISTARNKMILIGESPEETTFSFGTNSFTCNATDVTIMNLKILATSGGIYVAGNYSTVVNCHFELTPTAAAGNGFFPGGAGTVIANCWFKANNTTEVTNPYSFSGKGMQVLGCKFQGTPVTTGYMAYVDAQVTFSGNSMLQTGTGLGYFISCGGSANVSNNYFNGNNTACSGIKTAGNNKNNLDNNIFDLILGTGIQLSSQENIVSLNHIKTSDIGIDITSAGINNKISTNEISAAYASGSTKTGIKIAASGNNNTITDNTIRDGVSGITVASNYNYIRNNNLLNAGNAAGTEITDTGVANTTEKNIYRVDGSTMTYEKSFVRVKNANGSSLTQGQVVVLKSASTVDQVDLTTTSNDPKVLGIVAETITTTSYGMIQTLGKQTGVLVDGSTNSIAIGDYLTTSTTSGRLVKAQNGQTSIAIALATASTSTTIAVQIIPPFFYFTNTMIPIIETYPITTTSASDHATQQMYCAKIIAPISTTITTLRAYCRLYSGSANTVELGIYNNAATPAKLASATATVTATGIFSVTITAQNLVKGTEYWLCILNQTGGTTSTQFAFGSASANQTEYARCNTTLSSMPADLSTVTSTITRCYWIEAY